MTKAWRRESARRRAVNEALAAAGHAAAVVPQRPAGRAALRCVVEALRRGNDGLEAELRDGWVGRGDLLGGPPRRGSDL